jgi:pyrroline-5-carboxylate reductase
MSAAWSGRMVFIGAGNMAEAIIKGLLQAGWAAADRIRVTDVDAARLAHFAEAYQVGGLTDNVEAVSDAELVVLAVKPQGLLDVMRQLQPALTAQHLVLSIAAGIPTGAIEDAAGCSLRVVRAMPNTPALVGRGAAAICPGRWATAADLDVAERVLGAAGVVVRVAESQLDAVTAISGSGPAYVFYLMEAMQAAAAELGLDADTALRLIVATVGGSAALAEQRGEAPAVLRQRVTSKGGTTAAALAVLEEQGVRDRWVEAMRAAHRRAGELARGE